MNCAVLSYSLVTGASTVQAHAVLYTALGPFGANIAEVGRVLTRRGWSWLPGDDADEFIASYPRGRFILTWEGHYCALIDGETIGRAPITSEPMRFVGAWSPP